MKAIAARARGMSPSQTVAIDTRYKEMLAKGLDVLSLGAGEPDFDTPEPAKAAAIASIQAGKTKYTAPTGLPELKQEICAKLLRDNGLEYQPSQIVIGSGAKQCIFNAILSLVDPGDEVLIPTPGWVTYPELVKLVGGKPVLLATRADRGFKLDAEELDRAIGPRSKLLILNSPCNPTGAVYGQEELAALGEVLLRHDLFCLSDEIYEKILYGGMKHHSLASLSPALQERTVVVNGMSKAYAMTGWRIGYTAANPDLARVLGALQGQASHHPANASQYAAIAALRTGATFTEPMAREFARRREIILSALSKLPGIQALAPQGAFYVFFSVAGYLGKSFQGRNLDTSLQLCEYLLQEHRLALVPGSAFGLEGYVRASFACSENHLHQALDRLDRGLKALA